MTVRCTGCGAALKLDPQKLAGRQRAKCPRCGVGFDLPAASTDGAPSEAPTRVVSCACGARLKVPDGASAAKSRCPKCGKSVTLGAAMPAATPPAAPEESSLAATRRIDSRTLGMGLSAMNPPADPAADLEAHHRPASPPQGIDLDEFVGSRPAAAPVPPPEPTLTRPAVKEMKSAVEEIRDAAKWMAPPSSPAPARPAAPSREAAQAARPSTPPPVSLMPTPPAPVEAQPRRKSKAPAYAPYPAKRGALAGALAGALVGGGWWAALDQLPAYGLTWLLSPVTFTSQQLPLPDPAMRLGFMVLAAALAGLIAAGAGSPSRGSSPVSMLRCMSSALLPGAVLGLLAMLLPVLRAEPLDIWPAVNWMRDLLIAGLLTPAVNRILPGKR